jgi:outer membrane protein OmpA-like peptidoglycan-associated protein
MVDKKTGSYAIAMAVEDDEEVLMTVTKKNYSFTSKYFKPKDIKKAKTTKKVDLKVQPVKIGETVKINDIQFASNSTMFMKGSILILNNFIQFLQNNPKIKIEIHGHTDNVGGARANKKLSTRRAETIRNYLVFQGIEPSRIVAYKGFGESKPIASNKTEAGKAKNRRTEFVIVER